jgi:hypothetical protein
MRPPLALPSILAVVGFVAHSLPAQAPSIDLTVNDIGLSVGDSRRTVGFRLNYKDRQMEQVTGLNLTVFGSRTSGTVDGIAIGVPSTSARRITGVGASVLALGARERLTGVMAGGLWVHAATPHMRGASPVTSASIDGIAVAGITVNAVGRIRGLAVSPIVYAAGVPARMDTPPVLEGVVVGGIAALSSGRIRGITASGVLTSGRRIQGVNFTAGFLWADSSLDGVAISGLSASGSRVRGLVASGFRVGGGDITGVAVSGVFVNATRTLRGGAAAPVLIANDFTGVGIGGVVGGRDLTGGFVSLVGVSVSRSGTLHGVAASPINVIHGRQRGLTIGVINVANELHGVQVGVLNIARNNGAGRRVLPIANWHR